MLQDPIAPQCGYSLGHVLAKPAGGVLMGSNVCSCHVEVLEGLCVSTARIPGSVRLFSFKEKGAAPHKGIIPP